LVEADVCWDRGPIASKPIGVCCVSLPKNASGAIGTIVRDAAEIKAPDDDQLRKLSGSPRGYALPHLLEQAIRGVHQWQSMNWPTTVEAAVSN
jgi:hypothetical protein